MMITDNIYKSIILTKANFLSISKEYFNVSSLVLINTGIQNGSELNQPVNIAITDFVDY